MIANLFRFNGGIKPEYHKAASTAAPVRRARLPRRLILPLHQHIGESAKPVVEVAQAVLKGQVLARAEGYVSAPVHAPTSGRIVDVAPYPVAHPSGLNAPCIVLEPDGEDRWIARQGAGDWRSMDTSHLRNLVRDAGIVGLGGAGFPSFIKLNPGARKSIDTLILNGAECEPYISCDDMLMRERAEEIVAGMRIIRHALNARRCIIAIEDNKPAAIAAMRAAAAGEADTQVVEVPTLYPQGGEKQLIYTVTGLEVPSNGLPIHIGVVGQNVGTARAVYRAVELGEPLISRYVTVTGGAVRKPANLEVLFGTPARELLEECDADFAAMDRVLVGGPMMGFALHTLDAPVVKTANCILATGLAHMPASGYTLPCIRCGVCADACPVNLLPQQLYWHAKGKEFDRCQEYNLFDCIECGCCAYVCPSQIPLVQHYRYAKGEIWAKEREKEKAELARRRHEFRLERIDRDKQERAAKLGKKKAELSGETVATAPATAAAPPKDEAKQAAILAALERQEAKKAQFAQRAGADTGQANTPEPPTDRE